jgi:serine/threonine protein kinase
MDSPQQQQQQQAYIAEVDAGYLNRRFAIEDPPLGEGGSGKVFLILRDTENPGRDGRAVVKVCRHRYYHGSATLEANAHASVSGHPGIVALLETLVCRRPQASYIFTEFIAKGALFDVVKRDPGYGRRAGRAALEQLLDAVDYCHSRGILHMDISTGNVFVRDDDSVCLGDFGAARKTERSDATGLARAFRVQERMAALPARAPEVILSNLYIGKAPGLWASTATDMWGVGCVMAELFGAFCQLQLTRCATQHLSAVLMLSDLSDVMSWRAGLPFVEMHRQAAPTLKIGAARKLALEAIDAHQTLSGEGTALLTALLSFNPARRPSAARALLSPWFAALDQPASPDAAAMHTDSAVAASSPLCGSDLDI